MSVVKKIQSARYFIRRNGYQATCFYMLFRLCKLFGNRLQKVATHFLGRCNRLIESHHLDCDDLLRNKTLNGKCFGKTAVVMATGPSMRASISLINTDYIVIVVNEAIDAFDEEKRIPDFLVLNDRVYFSENKHVSFLKKILLMSMQSKLKLVFPLEQKPVIDSLCKEYFYLPKVFYYHTCSDLLEHEERFGVREFDFSKPLPGLPTVPHVALCFACYLGFSKIGLIGVDMDYVINPLKRIQHGYESSEQQEDSINCMEEYKRSMGWDYKTLLKNTLLQIRCYEVIQEVCQKKKIEVFNLSKESILDCYPFLSLEVL